jgi:2,3-diketo-5-methylthio-1-phosphopentane phosphatase
VTIRLAERGVRAVLLDIEGTTTPTAFVHDVLFPYARARLRAYLDASWTTASTRETIGKLAAEHAADVAAGVHPPAGMDAADPAAAIAYLEWLMDRDRKSPALKQLQGEIWRDGYRAGVLRGEVFDDVPRAIARWRDAGLEVAIYSSGSEQAQRDLFSSTPHGDLTPLISGHFDTAMGPKVESSSYARIANRLRRVAFEVLFVSDLVTELSAAREADLQVVLSVRPGNPPQPRAELFDSVTSFDEIEYS